eukprot:2999415-Pleurochrysis_carterae.AAC.4
MRCAHAPAVCVCVPILSFISCVSCGRACRVAVLYHVLVDNDARGGGIGVEHDVASTQRRHRHAPHGIDLGQAGGGGGGDVGGGCGGDGGHGDGSVNAFAAAGSLVAMRGLRVAGRRQAALIA